MGFAVVITTTKTRSFSRVLLNDKYKPFSNARKAKEAFRLFAETRDNPSEFRGSVIEVVKERSNGDSEQN